MDAIRDILVATGEHLGDLAKGDAVLGSPIQVGNVTVYPVSRISVGVAAGGGTGDEACSGASRGRGGCSSGKGGGSGGGMRARPVALIVFSEQGVQVLPIPDKKSKVDEILDKIPGLIDKIKEGCHDRG